MPAGKRTGIQKGGTMSHLKGVHERERENLARKKDGEISGNKEGEEWLGGMWYG